MLNPLDSALRPDRRFANMSGAGGTRPITFAEYHAWIAEIDFPSAAPDDVRSVFGRSLNVMLYSWFNYELMPLAELQAFAALEMALRQKLGVKGTLWPLTERAIKQGLIRPKLGDVPTPLALSHMRNLWAHGSANFGGPAFTLRVLALCAKFIDSLYPKCETNTKQST